MTPVLAVEHLEKAFQGFRAVADVSFRVNAGEMVALIGPNGAGKTTTFNLINGQLAPDRGQVLLDGRDITGTPPADLCHLGAGRTFQITATFPSMTVLENVAIALIRGNRNTTSAGTSALAQLASTEPMPWESARALLAEVGMSTSADQMCGTLAYGDLKRIELAMAIANAPRLLLMDEPTAGMAPKERGALMDLVARIARERQAAVLFTEHDMDVVFGHAHRVLVMNRGKLIAEGTPDEIRRNALVREVYLGTLSTTAPPASASMREVGHVGAGRDLAEQHRSPQPDGHSTPDPSPSRGGGKQAEPPGNRAGRSGSSAATSGSPAEPARNRTEAPEASSARAVGLRVENLDAWYGRAQVLHGVSLHVAPGEAVVLLGRNGAGKSTTLKAVMGLEVERHGRITFNGDDIATWPTHRIARAGLGFVPEDRRVFAGLTVMENLAAGRLPARDGHAWTPEELFQLFPNLGHMQDRLAARMSGGEQQMLTIARTLMGNPRCMLLDEPSEGLAPVIVEAIAAAVIELKRRGVGLLISEQNLHFARLVADRATIIERGVIRYAGTIAELDADPKLSEQYLSV